MYTHILLVTDDSEAAGHATEAAIALAAQTGARLDALYVLAPQAAVSLVADAIQGGPHARRAIQRADRALAWVRERAGLAGVPCGIERVSDRRPYAAIASAAARLRCDLIVMGAHDGPSAGNLTHKVMLNCDVPLLVCR